MDIITVAAARKPEAVGREVTVRGWVRTRRDSKSGFSFLELNDGSCQGNLQVVADAAVPNYEAEIKKLSAGCSVIVTGTVNSSPAQGQATELKAASVTVAGWSPVETYPLQKKQHSWEFLRGIAH
jgi:asparaginyl-tRNA synthetase